MKLKDAQDKLYFLADVGRLDLIDSLQDNEEIPDELFEEFIKKRRPLITGLVSFQKSQLTKQQWRSSRWKFLRGIRKFHRSLAGKRLHRSLARFLATRILRPHLGYLKDRYESLEPLKFDALKALSSCKTHMYIEEEYYSVLSEAAEYSSFMEYAIPLLNSIEWRLYQNPDSELSADEQELLLRLADERELCKSLSEVLGTVTADKIFEAYKGVQHKMFGDGSSADETYFYSRLIENFIPCLLDLHQQKTHNT